VHARDRPGTLDGDPSCEGFEVSLCGQRPVSGGRVGFIEQRVEDLHACVAERSLPGRPHRAAERRYTKSVNRGYTRPLSCVARGSQERSLDVAVGLAVVPGGTASPHRVPGTMGCVEGRPSPVGRGCATGADVSPASATRDAAARCPPRRIRRRRGAAPRRGAVGCADRPNWGPNCAAQGWCRRSVAGGARAPQVAAGSVVVRPRLGAGRGRAGRSSAVVRSRLGPTCA
jgi:hypothetical protein